MTTNNMTRWLNPQPVNTDSLESLGLHPLAAQTLIRRGIQTPDSARAFLDPLHSAPTPASALPGMDSAVERISSALRTKEPICVWGDFDVDGQTSTTLLVQTLQALGANVTYYIPIRGKESHGVHVESLKPIIDNGAKLIITCDTGITAHEAIDYANSRGVNVVITDHHDLGETLPNAKAVVNPKLLPEDHPLANLAGVGVAYKLAEALLSLTPNPSPSGRGMSEGQGEGELLDLVALGLIADVALLRGETRSLAQKGIQKLRETKRLGLKVIAELSGTNLETLTEETIGFTFAPRLNALGRLGDANPAVELLITNNPARARVLAAQIEGLNAQRRLLTSQVYEAAEAQLRENPDLLTEPAIVLSHPNWPGGVVGIVANRLVDRYHKPALLLTESDDGILRGSARSVDGLHITEAITANRDLLLGFGGHPMAAGLSLQAENLTAFRKGLGKAVEKQLGEITREEPTLQIDAWLGLNEINLELAAALESLAPFGAGNPSLTLATRGVQMKSISTIGKTKEHLRLTVEDESGTTQSILWWGGAGEELPEEGRKIDIAYSLRASSYRGQKQVSMQFEEFRVVEEKPVELKPKKLEIVDYRLNVGRLESLKVGMLVWAEGSEKAKGKSRFDLHRADEFAIYTTPSSPVELRKALEIVQPKTIYVFAVPPAEEKTDDFLSRLAGLCKYALNQRGGKVAVHELAAAMASRESAIQIGLEWLAAGGHLSVRVEDDQVTLSAEKPEANQYLQKELYIALKGSLNETSAYRKYISTVSDLKGLIERNL
ncbi:MAG: single-stranded-DNA-specific exonuclease RecJ [Chloroflexi bacterium]|nr:single-stranded-DNA-specific exonuclease RecJ [Chloroflexota bacterium]